MTSQGSPYAIFRRALARGDLTAIRSAASDLPSVPLEDALEILLLILEQEPQRFERSALRWLSRLLDAGRVSQLEQAERVLAYLAALPDPSRRLSAMEVLSVLAGRPRDR